MLRSGAASLSLRRFLAPHVGQRCTLSASAFGQCEVAVVCTKQQFVEVVRALRAATVFTILGAVAAPGVRSQDPSLPSGALTEWIIREPEEIVGWLAVDVRDIAAALPTGTRYVTIGELARRRVGWAVAHLRDHSAHADWGVSFFEVIRAGTFTIDGRTPQWPVNGAAALWAARIEHDQKGPSSIAEPAFVLLDFWIPDSPYVQLVRAKGHYAEYASVTLDLHNGRWHGIVETADLSVAASCTPNPSAAVTEGSGGMQTFHPPANSGISELLRVAFAGHRIQECVPDAAWTFRGTHPLARTVMIAPPSFEAGYTLRGGAYHR